MEYSPSSKPTEVIQSQWKWKGLQWNQRLFRILGRFFKLFLHFIPVGWSAVLLWLSYADVYWFSERGLPVLHMHVSSNNILNWLQLVAKLYEVAVIASMASITLKAFKRTFVDTAIPFGFISAPYRVGDIFFLIDGNFWRGFNNLNWQAAWRMTAREWKVVALAVFFIVNTLLSLLVGPASAILIIPQLDWFKIPNAFSNITTPIFYRAPAAWIWPTDLNQDLWKFDQYCGIERGSFMYQCPAAGFGEIYTWAAGWEFSNLPDNITFQDPSGTVSRRLDMHSDDDTGTWVTTPTALLAKTMGQFKSMIRSKEVGPISQTEKWQFKLSKSSQNYQPLVQAKCNIWNSATEKESLKNMSLPYEQLNCFGEPPGGPCRQIKDELKTWTVSNNLLRNNADLSYVIGTTNSIKEPNPEDTASSLVFAAGLPYFANGAIRGQHVVGCSYMAHWIPSVPMVDPSNTEYIETNITKLDVFAKMSDSADTKSDATIGSVINTDQSWLSFVDLSLSGDSVNQTTGNSTSLFLKKVDNEFIIGTLLTAMQLVFPNGTSIFGPGGTWEGDPEPDSKVAQVIEKLTGAIITDALARTAASTQLFMILSDEKTDDSYALDPLFVQEGPNAFEFQLYKNGTLTSPYGVESVNPFKGLGWNNLDDLKTKLTDNIVTVDFVAKQYGYGYGQPGPPSRFALTVVITYLAILLVYCIIVLFSGVKSIKPWGDVQDLIALAWCSAPPPELKGQGVEVVDEHLWAEGVTVMATASNYVSLVLSEEQPGMRRLKKNEEYY
ncbi:hypothetical protein BGZ63DRAFT_395578 [Mariannaea sp. PMI_226]|nr:hypothetical protein BGZ63DRAFT_395578 [Mariannaea sp. PMI_226]